MFPSRARHNLHICLETVGLSFFQIGGGKSAMIRPLLEKTHLPSPVIPPQHSRSLLEACQKPGKLHRLIERRLAYEILHMLRHRLKSPRSLGRSIDSYSLYPTPAPVDLITELRVMLVNVSRHCKRRDGLQATASGVNIINQQQG